MRLPLAVLIDGENINADLFAPLKGLVEALGEPIIWQLHGDLLPWGVPWQDMAERYGLDLRQVFHGGGKNSADIAMTTAAMDILYAGKVGGFCIVSSDSDFVPLARRLRADNVRVYGFGEPKTANAFRLACNTFHELRRVEAKPAVPLKAVVNNPSVPKAAPPKTPAKPASKAATPAAKTAPVTLSTQELQLLRDCLQSVCREQGSDGWVTSERVSTYVHSRSKPLAKRIGGTGKFLKNLERLDLVEVRRNGNQKLLSVRHKPLALVR